MQKPPRVHSLRENQTGSQGACTAPAPAPAPRRRPGACPHLPHLILTAAGFPEVGHGRELGVDRLAVKPAVVQVNHGLFRIFFTAKLQTRNKNACLSPLHVRDFLLLLQRDTWAPRGESLGAMKEATLHPRRSHQIRYIGFQIQLVKRTNAVICAGSERLKKKKGRRKPAAPPQSLDSGRPGRCPGLQHPQAGHGLEPRATQEQV